MRHQSVRILGTPVSILSVKRALHLFDQWVVDRCDRYVVFRDVHGVMLARRNTALHRAHQESDLVAPDGLPLVWAGRIAGFNEISRVCGPDLLLAVCEHGMPLGWRHYFYGGGRGVAKRVARELAQKFPGIKIVGTQCPPFRPLTESEDRLACASIRAERPNFVWVGLGTPKQEIWMMEHRGKCGGAILLGVGAAFDVCCGLKSRAPLSLQKCGLEWAYRLAQEPKRLWRRYLQFAPMFVVLASFELMRAKMSRSLAAGREKRLGGAG
jgi:N-acetylglucosaminyldiphosphoundecaprenol N-acetyl-beta-D-mannosaminyltransferase